MNGGEGFLSRRGEGEGRSEILISYMFFFSKYEKGVEIFYL